MLEHTKSLPEGFFSGLELLGAGWDGFSLPSERGTSGFQVVPAGLEYRAGKNIQKSGLAFAVRSYWGVFCMVWFGFF